MGGDFFRGFMQGFAPVLAQGITQRMEQDRQKLQDETDFLQKMSVDPNASDDERSAAMYALTQLASSKKPGKGYQAYKKRTAEITEAKLQGARGPYGMVAGQQPVGGEGPEGKMLGPMGAPGAAALPSTSPVAGGGSAQEDPEGKMLGGPPPPSSIGGQQPPSAAPGTTGPQPYEGVSEQELLARGAQLGMSPPMRLPKPVEPDRSAARKLDLDFYREDMLRWQSAEDRYVDYLNRIAQLVYQERKQKETQSFERSERLETQSFKAGESKLERESEEREAGIRTRGATSVADKEATLRERQALAAYRRDLQQIERDKGKPTFEGGLKGPTGVDQAEVDRRTRAAAEIYEMATGQPAPPLGAGKDGGPPPLEPEPYFKKGVEGPPPPAASAKDLDKLRGGPEIRARIEDARRKKVDSKKICADIAQLPQAYQAAARAYARCP